MPEEHVPRYSVVVPLHDEEQVLPALVELRAFVAYLDGGPAPRSSSEEGLRVVEAIAGLDA